MNIEHFTQRAADMSPRHHRVYLGMPQNTQACQCTTSNVSEGAQQASQPTHERHSHAPGDAPNPLTLPHSGYQSSAPSRRGAGVYACVRSTSQRGAR